MANTHFGRALEKRVAEKMSYCAVWAVGPTAPIWYHGANRAKRPVKFGTSADPQKIVWNARQWNWEDVDLRAVVWCTNRADAMTIAQMLQGSVDDADRMTSAWFDLEDRQIHALIVSAAAAAGIEILNEATRVARLEIEIAKEVKRLKSR